jgi:general secretion pathway protein N
MKAVLGGLALLLFGVLALQWRGWSPDAAVPPPPAASPSAASSGAAPPSADGLVLEAPPQEDYASVVERPLFLPERRPPPDEPEDEAVPEPEELTELDRFDLTAIVITPTVVSAWVRDPQAPELARLRLGDDFVGWTVKTIEPAKLVLERQGETHELHLRDYANAPPPIPPTRLPPRTEQRGAGPNDPSRAGQRRADRGMPPGVEPDAPGTEPPQRQRRDATPAPQPPMRRVMPPARSEQP